MGKKKSNVRLLTRPFGKKVITGLDDGTIDPKKALVQGYDELRDQYDAAGKDKSVLYTDPGFNIQEERYGRLLGYCRQKGHETSSFTGPLEEMLDRIRADAQKDKRDLGALAIKLEKKKIYIVPAKRLRAKYAQTSTLTGCLELLESLFLIITPENSKNAYGHFLGVYKIFTELLERSAAEDVDINEERSQGLAWYKAGEQAFCRDLAPKEQIAHNDRCIHKPKEE